MKWKGWKWSAQTEGSWVLLQNSRRMDEVDQALWQPRNTHGKSNQLGNRRIQKTNPIQVRCKSRIHLLSLALLHRKECRIITLGGQFDAFHFLQPSLTNADCCSFLVLSGIFQHSKCRAVVIVTFRPEADRKSLSPASCNHRKEQKRSAVYLICAYANLLYESSATVCYSNCSSTQY